MQNVLQTVLQTGRKKVEVLAKYARADFMTPIPEAASYDDLNAMLVNRRGVPTPIGSPNR